MAGIAGAAVPGRLSLVGPDARPTELFSYKKSPANKRPRSIVIPSRNQKKVAQAKACGYKKYLFEHNSVLGPARACAGGYTNSSWIAAGCQWTKYLRGRGNNHYNFSGLGAPSGAPFAGLILGDRPMAGQRPLASLI
jgi:hypothetical protein